MCLANPSGAPEHGRSGEEGAVCHECLWNGFSREFQEDVVGFYSAFTAADPLVAADVDYILWRATGVARCASRQRFRHVADNSRHPYRVLSARAMLGFSGPECGEDGRTDLRSAVQTARSLGFRGTARALDAAASVSDPVFADQRIDASIVVPAGATTFVLGATRLELTNGTRIGAQVERVARDWVSYQMRWSRDGSALTRAQILDYHEGAFIRTILDGIDAPVVPLGGVVVARRDRQWFAPDENGVFRFEVLEDKVQYPTSHTAGDFGWLEDTHGISAIAGQAIDRKMQVVVGCGDAEGKAKAALYLAQRGVHVIFPGDRFQDLLLGYRAPGVVLGGAPIRQFGGKVVIGGQPVRFSIREPIVVSDATLPYPIQYYDGPARYFRRLAEYVPLQVIPVVVDGVDQIARILSRAAAVNASVVAVRVMTRVEDETLRSWLSGSPERRAVLFHSALYPYAQGLFRDFPGQVTFGDLHPLFE